MTEELLGYVCLKCGWWIPTLGTEHSHCQHSRVALVEHLSDKEVAEAKHLALEHYKDITEHGSE